MARAFFERTISGSEVAGIADLDVPEPHWTLWGLGADVTVIDKSVEPDRTTSFVFAARFASSLEAARSFPFVVGEKEIAEHGDSAYRIGDDVRQFRMNYVGKSVTLNVVRNADGRLAGFKSEPISSLTFSGAIGVARSVTDKLVVQFSSKTHAPGIVDLVHVESLDLLQRYLYTTLPYPFVPLSFRYLRNYKVCEPFLSLYAEGIRAPSVFYRFLCFFKITDKLLDLNKPLRDITLQHGVAVPTMNGKVPSDPFQYTGPEYVGKKYTVIRNDLQSRYRNTIAHLDLSSPIQPFNVEVEGDVQRAAMVLSYAANDLLSTLQNTLTALASTGCDVEALTLTS